MGTIRTYSSEVSAGGIPQTRRVQSGDLVDTSGLKALGDASDQLEKIDQQNQQLSAEKEFSKTYLSAQQEILKLRETASGEEDLTGATMAIYDKHAKMAQDQFGGSFGKRYLESKFAGNRDNVGISSLQFESQLKSQKRLLDLDEKIDAARNIVLGDPTQFKNQMADLEATIELVPLNGVAKAKVTDTMREGMAQSYIARLTDMNPALAKKELSTPLINSMIKPELKAAALAEITRKQEASALKGIVEQMRYAPAAQRREMALKSGNESVMRAADHIERVIAADPAAYVFQAPEVKAAFAAYENAAPEVKPQATANYITASLALQERVGVPDYARKVLPDSQTSNIVGKVMDAFGNKQDVHGMMQGLQAEYGEYWPRVAQELQSAKLPPAAMVISAMDKPKQQAYGAMLSRAVSEGADNVYTAAGPDAKKDLGPAVASSLSGFRESMVRTPGGVNQYAAFESATGLLAAKLMQTNGISASAAAQQAASILANDHFTFQETYRVPAAYDPDMIGRGAQVAMESLNEDMMLADSPAFGAVSPGDRKAMLANIKRSGYWVNSPEGDGLILFQQDGLPVALKDGGFMRYSFEELEAMKGMSKSDKDSNIRNSNRAPK